MNFLFNIYENIYKKIPIEEEISENRNFKTLSSIRSKISEYDFFEGYVKIEELIFSPNLTIDFDQIFQQIISILDQNQGKNEYLFEYFIELSMDFILIRPKQKQVACNLLSKHILRFQNKLV